MLSRPENIAHTLYALDNWFARRHSPSPARVCDIGPGWGKWGIMLRELVASRLAEAGDMTPDVSQALTLDAVEMCAYFQAYLRNSNIYDHRFCTDFRLWPDALLTYDLYLFFDVLEHWSKAEIQETLTRVLRVTPQAEILVSIPKHVHMYEAPYYGEDCPKHCSALTPGDYAVMLPTAEIEILPNEVSHLFWVRNK